MEHLNALLSLKSIKRESATGLRALRTTITKNLGALKSLGRDVSGYSDILINRVTALLDTQTKRDWELSLAARTDYPTFDELDQFLINRIQVLTKLKPPPTATVPLPAHSKGKPQPVKSHFTVAEDSNCPICKENHVVYKCKTFKPHQND